MTPFLMDPNYKNEREDVHLCLSRKLHHPPLHHYFRRTQRNFTS